jgi:hypothetical protein
MTEPRSDSESSREAAGQTRPVRYPTNHLLAILDNRERVATLATALRNAGFRDSEIEFGSGEATADAIAATTGHRGLVDLTLRLADRLGVWSDEMAMKEKYEQALRDGGVVVSVAAPTDDRKTAAAEILSRHGARYINFLGTLSVETIRP